MVREAAQVAQRCMEAQESGKVDLSNCGLMSIPDALFLFLKNTKVSAIDVSGNQLKRIPAKLATEFPHVTTFDLSNNAEVSSLPKEFSSLADLTILNLSKNKFSRLPVLNLPSLKELNLSNNIIKEVNEEEVVHYSHVKSVLLFQNNLSQEAMTALQNHQNFFVKENVS